MPRKLANPEPLHPSPKHKRPPKRQRMSAIPQRIDLTPEDEAALDAIWRRSTTTPALVRKRPHRPQHRP